MHLKQGDLFLEMDKDFVKTVTELGVNISCREGDIIFGVGDKADFFYILLKGSVIMQRGKGKWYTANHPGEVFGWSALIHRDEYAAIATSGPVTELIRFERKPFLDLLEKSPHNKAVLYDHLASKLGNQLLETYISITC
jgi:CRP-like cAMP-binding protein